MSFLPPSPGLEQLADEAELDPHVLRILLEAEADRRSAELADVIASTPDAA
jgi:hypothetical protein